MLKIILLFIASLLNLVLGLFIIFKNYKNKINLYYGLLALGTFLWSLGMSLIHITFFNEWALNELIIRLIYIPAFLIPLFYFLFVLHFPYKTKLFFQNLVKPFIFISVVLTFLVILGILKPELLKLDNNIISQTSASPDYLILMIYYFVYILTSIIILFKKYFESAGVIKNQLGYVIIATLLSFILILVVSIVLPILNNFKFDWLGPLFTLINFFIIGYFVIKSEIDFKLIR
jgi:hypothetical protein